MIELDGSSLTLEAIDRIARGESVTLGAEARVRVAAARAVVDARVASGEPSYGINTGFVALARAGLRPVTLAPKEGLALINGTQASTAMLALAVLAATRLARAADIAAAMSIDALRGSLHPFEPRVQAARP